MSVYALPFLLVFFSMLSCSGAQACLLATHHGPACDAQCSLSFSCSSCDASLHACDTTCYTNREKNVIVSGERFSQTAASNSAVIVSETISLPDNVRQLFNSLLLSHESTRPIYLTELNLLC